LPLEGTLRKSNATTPALIAPCGINCHLCHAFLRDKKPCPGCRGDDALKSSYCVTCRMKLCEKRASGVAGYCGDCDSFPCARLKQLDKRYRTKYAASPIANLRNIQEFGIDWLVRSENEHWGCPHCGEMLCMHSPQCLVCGFLWHSDIP
jgi:hypothetical protein